MNTRTLSLLPTVHPGSLIMAILAVAFLTLLGDASAADTVTSKAGSFLCKAYNTLNGPIGWGLGLLMIAFGAVMLMTGNRNANGIIISAILGGIVLAASGTLLGLVIGNGGLSCAAAGNL